MGPSKDGFIEELDFQTRFESRDLVERFSGIEGYEHEGFQRSSSGVGTLFL